MLTKLSRFCCLSFDARFLILWPGRLVFFLEANNRIYDQPVLIGEGGGGCNVAGVFDEHGSGDKQGGIGRAWAPGAGSGGFGDGTVGARDDTGFHVS